MRNRFPQISFLLLAVAVIFSSCSKIPDQMNAIPSDASMVAVFNTKQLLLKAKMDKFNETKIYKKIKTILESEDPGMSKMVDVIIKNPQETGLKVTSDMCFYMNAGDNYQFNFGFIAKIKNKEKFEACITQFANATKTKIDIKKEAEISYINLGQTDLVIWNKSRLLLLKTTNYSTSAQELLERAKKQLLQKKENSILATPDFVTFYKNQKDIDFWISNKNMQKLNSANQSLAGMFPAFYFSTTTHMHTQFNNGEIKLTAESVMSDSLRKAFEEKPLLKTFDKQVLKTVPGKSFLAFSFSVNMSNIYDLFIKKLPQIDQIDAVLQQKSLTLKDVFNSIGGDFILTLNEIGSQEMSYASTMPAYDAQTGEEIRKDTTIQKTIPKVNGTICLSLNTSKVIDSLMTLIPQGTLQKEGNIYNLPVPFMPLYMSISDKLITISSQKEVTEQATSGGLKTNLMDTEIGKDISKSASYMYMDLNIKSYPGLEKLFFENKDTDPKKQAFYNIWSIFDSMKASSNSSFNSEGAVKLTSDKENSLYLILKTIDDNFENFL